jgi:signal transduction histidine kinase
MSILLIILIVFTTLLGYLYFDLKKGLLHFKNEIEEKKRTKSNVIFVNQSQDSTIADIIEEFNQLSIELRKTKYINKLEKETLDLAIHNITHDIRTPLTVASGYTQALLKEPLDEKMTITLKKIQHHQNKVSERLEVLLEYQNILEKNVKPNFTEINLSQVIKEQIITYYDSFIQANFQVKLDIEDDCFISNDEGILARLIQNVLGNALKHGREKLFIQLKNFGENIYFFVHNYSQNPIKNIDLLTRRFYSENMSQTEESSGLGLFIVQELADLTNGTLRLNYEDNLFKLTLCWQQIKKS